jgi:hypothetical protein
MDFLSEIFLPLKGKKDTPYLAQYRNYQKAIKRNPEDEALRAQLVKFCLENHFALDGIPDEHLMEALGLYEELAGADHFDPQVYYLVGRYYHPKDNLKAQTVYLNGVRHFNRYVEKNPGIKADHVDLAYAIALNFVALQYGQIHPDLDKFFKIVRKSYPLHNKWMELENELRKTEPDPDLVKRLAQDLREIKQAVDATHSKRVTQD